MKRESAEEPEWPIRKSAQPGPIFKEPSEPSPSNSNCKMNRPKPRIRNELSDSDSDQN